MALALVLGWPRRLGQAGAAALAGTAISIGVGWLLAAVLDLSVDLDANTQVVSRASPTLSDLIVAVAAGAAGGYVLSRTQVSSSLPGIAIAIALMPPLSVVGVTAEQGSWSQAGGTLLLFLTNLVAIVVVGGVVWSIESILAAFAVRTVLNVGVTLLAGSVLGQGQDAARLAETFFYLMQIALVTTLHDHFRPVLDHRGLSTSLLRSRDVAYAEERR